MEMNKLPSDGITLTPPDFEDFITCQYLKSSYERGLSVLTDESCWVFSTNKKCREWIYQAFSEHMIFSQYTSYIYVDTRKSGGNGLFRFKMNEISVKVILSGTKEDIQYALDKLQNSMLQKSTSQVNWVHSKDFDTIQIPMLERGIIKSAYPWIKEGIDAYIERYLESDASTLILIGPPGTGKTSFIRYMITSSGGSATVAYDEKIMSTDTLFANWLDSSDMFLCLEDSDAFLSARKEGNKMMHKFLNVSEGLVTIRGKKLIFSTNLPNISDIDDALIRTGRCFDVMGFRELDYHEAMEVANEVGVKRDFDKNGKYTLAQVMGDNHQPKQPTKTFGFI